jgi:hypothetical protein
MFTIIDWCAKYNILKINIIYYFGWIVSKFHMILMVLSDDIWCDEIDCFDVIKFTKVVIGEMCY